MRYHFLPKILFAVFITFGFNCANALNSDNYANCGNDYDCFGYPANCVGSKSCNFLVMYTKKARFTLIAKESDMANR